MNATSGSGGRLEFGFDFHPKAGGAPKRRRSQDAPFRILLLADLSGRAQRNMEDATDLASRPCMRVDVDAYDSVLMKYAPRINWSIGQLNFKRLDDFHPDRLYSTLAVFQSLRSTRAKLNDPSTFAEMAEQLRSETPGQPSPDDRASEKSPAADDFRRLMGKPAERSLAVRPSPAKDALSAAIQKLVVPYILPAADPRLDQYLASVDMAIGDQMRAILHDPDFQALESTWRGIWDLVTSLELDENLELTILDVTKQEILEDLRSHMTDFSSSGIHRQWVDNAGGAPGGAPWSIIVGHYAFAYNKEDIGLLAGLGLLALHAGAPFIADAHASLLGCQTVSQFNKPSEWKTDLPLFDQLRKSPVAAWIGLAMPRILMRYPYGERSDEIDAFDFEELGDTPEHEHFLWGRSAVACAQLLGRAFQERGWSFSPQDCLDLDDLPAVTLHAETGKELKPCAEVFLSDRVGEAISRRGLIALMSYRHRNAVRIRNFQSISDPPAALSGPWG